MNLPGYDAWKLSGPPEPRYTREVRITNEATGESFETEIGFDHDEEISDVVCDEVRREWPRLVEANISWEFLA